MGGGLAGLQFALTAAERGHAVTLIERKQHLGGMWHHASAPPGREQLFSFLEWLVGQCSHVGVEFVLGEEATPQSLKKRAADLVAVSPGSTPVTPRLPGSGLPHVHPATEALEGRISLGKRVAIIGGGGIGVEIAPFIAKRAALSPEVLQFLEEHQAFADNDRELLKDAGHQVVLISRQRRVGGSVGPSTRWVLGKEAQISGVHLMTAAVAREITPEGVMVEQSGEVSLVPADTVLLATGLKPDTSLFEALKEAGVAERVELIGHPEQAMHAIEGVSQAFRMALEA